MSQRRACITGIGLATAQGDDAASTWDRLLGGVSLHEPGHVPLTRDVSVSRVSQLAQHVAQQALRESNWHDTSHRTALIVGTSKGPIDEWLGAGNDLSLGVSEPAVKLAHALNITGPVLTIAAACASGLQALVRAKMMIDNNEADRVIVIGVESSLHVLFEASFKRLGVIARRDIGCRPFDTTREGFLIAEAAAAVCVEAVDSPGAIFIERAIIGSDPTHLTGIAPDGEPLRRLLRHVIDDSPVDLVHAHGTGTIMNDAVELAAIEACCTGLPNVYSHKHALGHTQGAAGLLAVVINVLAHRTGIIPPNSLTQNAMPHTRVVIENTMSRRAVDSSVVIGAGFGGAMACVRLGTR